MPSRKSSTLIRFTVPPKEYNQRYFADLTRKLSVFVQQEINPGEGRATRFTMTNLRTDDQGLEVGGLFNWGGIVKIAVAPHGSA